MSTPETANNTGSPFTLPELGFNHDEKDPRIYYTTEEFEDGTKLWLVGAITEDGVPTFEYYENLDTGKREMVKKLEKVREVSKSDHSPGINGADQNTNPNN